ncbi:MAG: hypothetical protein AAFN93_17780 [Bacteroidota bacterium]
MYIKTFIPALLLIFSIHQLKAQSGFNWPEDEDTAKEKNVLYNDNLKGKNYAEAAEPLEWLLTNAPDLNPAIYINGVKIYEALAKGEKDEATKRQHEEKVLSLYDARIENFGNEGKVMNRKAFSAYKFYKGRKDKYEELYQIFEKTFELNGSAVSTNLLVAYMDVLRRYKAASGPITDDDVLDRYDKVGEIMSEKIANGESAEKVNKQKTMVDKMLTSIVKVDCDFIENKLGAKLKANMTDVALAKKIMGLSLASDCSGNPIFLEAAKVVQENEPDFGIAKVIGLKSAAAGNIDEAMKYFNKAVELADSEEKKGEIYYEMATQFAKKGQKSQARQHALKAVGADASLTKSYLLIGDLYFYSFDQCKQEKSRVDDRAVYLAAYDMYQKAGSSSRMKSAQAQFPSIGEMFELNKQEGETIQVGCWINTSTTLRRRPE